MKHFTKLSIFLMLFSITFTTAHSQNVAVPDPIFEQALIDRNFDDVLDGFIDQSNVDTKFYLSINEAGITDITGIEAFIGLKSLSLWDNNLQTVDLSSNTLLETVLLRENNLTSIILPAFSSIELLDLRDNQLTTIDLGTQINLEKLNLSENNFSVLNLNNNVNLKELFVNQNNFSFLNINSNINLEKLSFSQNTITSLDISNLTSLKTLQGPNNLLTSLDVSNNTLLQSVWMYNNEIESLDFTNNPDITFINIYGNKLTYLNIKNDNNLTLSSFYAYYNPDLECIIVDDENYDGGTTPWGNDAWQYDTDIATLSETDCSLPEPPPIFVYPNPFRTILRISPNDLNINRYNLYNMFGVQVKSGTVSNNKMFISGINDGRYIIRLFNNSGLQATKSVFKSRRGLIRWLEPREIELPTRIPIRELTPIKKIRR